MHDQLVNKMLRTELLTKPLNQNQLSLHLVVSESDNLLRFDEFLFRRGKISKRLFKKLTAEGKIRLNGRSLLGGSPRLESASVVEVLAASSQPEFLPEAIPLTILFENDELMIIDKPAGMVVHPGPGHWAGTVVNALRALDRPLSSIGGPYRPGIVHRLDAGTSGVMVIAKSNSCHQTLSWLFAAPSINKEYLAIVVGSTPWQSYQVQGYLRRKSINRKSYAVTPDGKFAQTNFRTIAQNNEFSLLEAKPLTGRTHQIRVHLAHVGFPILGDTLYGGGDPAAAIAAPFALRRTALHSARLWCDYLKLDVSAPLPADMTYVLEQCGLELSMTHKLAESALHSDGT